MPQEVRIETDTASQKPLSGMRAGEWGILTRTPGFARSHPGHPVVCTASIAGIKHELFFPVAETGGEGAMHGYFYRPLDPGERIVIEGI